MDTTNRNHALRPGLPPLPRRIAALPVDKRGYPVPWFVEWIDGEPEFRAADGRKAVLAVQRKLCWVCGQPLGTRLAFLVGPMCGINRISAEPPSHRECAKFSAIACPFLSIPKMVRREGGLPEEAGNPGGLMIRRNPGVSLLWCTRSYEIMPAPPSFLFQMGEPFEVAWYAEGRPATRAEVDASIESGLPCLLDACNAEPTAQRRAGALEALQQAQARLVPLLPGREAMPA